MTVYAGTDRGVFKSANGGETWTAASNGLGPFSFPNQPPQINVTHLVAAPTNPQIIYAGTNRGFFMIFVVSSLIASLLMFLCVPLLRRLTSSVKA